MQAEGSLSCSQGPATDLRLEPYEYSPYLWTIPLRSILILFSHLRLGSLSDLLPSEFPI
jgi:hypothetical protein